MAYEIPIWQAARATSAAPGYFAPIALGHFQSKYADGGMVANNPVNETLMAAKRKWSGATVSCLVSIGSGHLHMISVPENAFDFVTYLARLATETGRAADLFVHQNRHMALTNNYFRFSVLRGLEDVGFDDTSKLGLIATVSARYCEE